LEVKVIIVPNVTAWDRAIGDCPQPKGQLETTENFRKGGVHEVGTVVFTVSAQFGVPVANIWALINLFTSSASELSLPLARVEYAHQKESGILKRPFV
jgi:hypothetical protein